MMVVVAVEVVDDEIGMLLKVVAGGLRLSLPVGSLDIKPYIVHVSSWALPWLELTTRMGW